MDFGPGAPGIFGVAGCTGLGAPEFCRALRLCRCGFGWARFADAGGNRWSRGRWDAVLRGGQGTFESRDFGGVEGAPVGGFKCAKMDGANSDSEEFEDLVAELVAHMSDLSFEALLQDDSETVVGQGVHIHGPGEPAFDPDSAQHFFPVLDLEGFVEGDLVFLIDVAAGMGEGVGEVAVVGDQQEAFAFHVEAAHVEDARPFRGQEVEDGSAVAFVACGANKTLRFVERGGELLGGVEDALSGFDDVPGLDLGGKICDDMAVDPDFSVLDELFDPAAGSEAGGCEKAVETHGTGGLRRFWLWKRLKTGGAAVGRRGADCLQAWGKRV
jgi:hypothetical protein